MRSGTYTGPQLETYTAPTSSDLAGLRETVFVYHDESTVHANERPQQAWLMPGVSELRTKSDGRLIHISDFILETHGRLEILQGNKHTGLASTDAAVVIYPGTKGDKWWDMQQLCDQVKKKAIPIFDHLHPDCQGVFVFDCSSAHEAYGPAALRVQSMNLGSAGKQDNFVIQSSHLMTLIFQSIFEGSHKRWFFHLIMSTVLLLISPKVSVWSLKKEACGTTTKE